MDAGEVTIAEFSYAHNQGYDESFFTPYNQVPSMWIPQAEVANVITGLYPELAGEDRYEMDRSH